MYYVSLSILIVCGTAGVLVGKFLGVTWVNWHVVDVATVVFGGVGFFAVAGESYRLTPANELRSHEHRLENSFLHLRDLAKQLLDQVCRVFTETPNSPPALDRVQQQHDLACPWARDLYATLSHLDPESLPPFGPGQVPDLPDGVTDQHIIDLRRQFCDHTKVYTKHRSFVMDFRQEIERPFIESVFVFLSPYFVSVAIGLALFKALYAPE